ncbi:MAG: DUF4390 domain-containing protein [bacterium]|nr:DUF4390 domain-containing protein [bacterium]
MSQRFSLTVLTAVLACLLASSAAWAERRIKPTIDGLQARLDGDRAIVSYRVVRGMSGDVLERIHSGIAVQFRHRIEILSRRAVPLWPSRSVARTVVETSASYDSLTGRYELTRTTRTGKADPGAEERHSTDSRQEMVRWMTELHDVPLLDSDGRLATTKRLRLSVDSAVDRRYVMLMFPSTVSASAERPLEF